MEIPPHQFERIGLLRLVLLAFTSLGAYHMYWFWLRAHEARAIDPAAYGRSTIEAGWLVLVWTLMTGASMLHLWDPVHWLDPYRLLMPLLAMGLVLVLTAFSLREVLTHRGVKTSGLAVLLFNAFYLETKFAKLPETAPAVRDRRRQRWVALGGAVLFPLAAAAAIHGEVAAHPADELCDQAVDLFDAKKPQEAMQLLRRAIAVEPEGGVAQTVLAMQLLEAGKGEEAIGFARQAVTIYEGRAVRGTEDNPDRAKMMLAAAYLTIGRVELGRARDPLQSVASHTAATGRGQEAVRRSLAVKASEAALKLLEATPTARPAP